MCVFVLFCFARLTLILFVCCDRVAIDSFECKVASSAFGVKAH